MTRLAAWIMASPLNAVLATLLLGFSGIFGWAVAVPAALVGLRKGAMAGALPLVAALAVAAFHWSEGELTLLGTVFATWSGTLALGALRSWPVTLLAVVGTSALFTGFLQTAGSSQLATLFEQYQLVMTSLVQSDDPAYQALSQDTLVQLIGLWVCISASASLFIARSLQARLYNPGGFRQEFHGMRLSPMQSAICLVPLVLIEVWPAAEPIAVVFLIPVFIAGLALLHGVAGRKGWGNGPLVAIYLGLVFFAPVVTPVLMISALADSFFDFRQRMT